MTMSAWAISSAAWRTGSEAITWLFLELGKYQSQVFFLLSSTVCRLGQEIVYRRTSGVDITNVEVEIGVSLHGEPR